MPITLWVRLENREEQRLTWDGQDRWITYEFNSPVAAAVLDPDGNYPILKDRLHASYTQKTVRRGFHYWAQMSGAPWRACCKVAASARAAGARRRPFGWTAGCPGCPAQ